MNILVAVSDPETRESLMEALLLAGGAAHVEVSIVGASSPSAGHEALRDRPTDAVIADFGDTSIGFFAEARSTTPDTARIILVTNETARDAVPHIQAGLLLRYLRRPWDSADCGNLLLQLQRICAKG